MRRKRVILFVCLALLSLLFILFYCSPIESYAKRYEHRGGDYESKYEVHPEINIPDYGFGVSSIGAYERLMDRYITLTEVNILRIDGELRELSKQLKVMDSKLGRLSESLDRIEKALGIQQGTQEGESPAGENQQ